MAEVTNFEHNGVSIEASEPPEAMGGIGDNVVAIVGTAPDKAASVPLNVPFRINSRTLAALLDTTGDEAGTLPQVVNQILKVVKVPIYVVVVEEGADDAATLANVVGGVDPASGQKLGLQALTICQEDPTIIGAPGFASEQAVHSEMASLGKRLRARVVLDGIDGSVAEQVTNSEGIGGAELGYDPKTSLDEGLKKFVDWYKDYYSY